MLQKLNLILLSFVLLFTNSYGQSSREVIKTLRSNHSIYQVNGVAFVDDEKKPFTGKFIELADDGQKRSEYSYFNGRLEGDFFEWKSRGGERYISLKGSYKNGKLNGDYIEMWRANHKKKECTYKNGELDGKFVTYAGFQVEEPEFLGYYKLGKKDSTQTWFFEGGKPRTIQRWKNGQQHGLEVSYFANGQINSEVTYINGKKLGVAKIFFEEGQLSQISKYNNDLLDGEELYYYRNGKIKEKRSYKLGKKAGKFIWYNEDGSIKEETEYRL